MRRPWFVLAAVLGLLLFAPGNVFAAESGDPAQSTLGWVFRWLNFAIVFGGLGYLLAKKGRAFFRGRAGAITAAIQEAAAAREQAEQRRRAAEEKIARLDQEAAALRAQARRDAAAEAERIRALAGEEAQKVERAGQLEIEAAERAARMELKAMAARLAVERAEAMIRKRMTPETQAAIFRSFVESLGPFGPAPGERNAP